MRKLDYDDYNENSPNAERTFRSLPENYSGTYRIAYGITSIAKDAFNECRKLTSIDIPSTVKSIGDNAFDSCTQLCSINISLGVENIGKETFKNCINLSSIDIPSTVKSIGSRTFEGCTNLTNVKINPNSSLKNIGDYAFIGCKELSPFIIPGSVSYSGSNIFEGCKTNISNTIEEVSSNTPPEGKGDSSISSIDKCHIQNSTLIIPEGITRIEEYALINNTFTNVIIPASVESIGQGAFRNCDKLTSVIIPKGVTRIEDYTFEGCKELASVEISSSVISIGEGAFLKCEKLHSIIIPSSVIKIGKNAFSYCAELSIAVIQGNYIFIDWPLFVGCKKLNSIIPEHRIGNYVIDNGIVYNKAKTELYECLSCKCNNDIVIDQNVRTIHTRAFSNTKKINTLKLPPYLKKIEEAAFDLTSAQMTIYAQTVFPDNIELGGEVFIGIKDGEEKCCTLKVPIESAYDYRRSQKWSSKLIIKTISAEDIASK